MLGFVDRMVDAFCGVEEESGPLMQCLVWRERGVVRAHGVPKFLHL
jgi:hypothetical protein